MWEPEFSNKRLWKEESNERVSIASQMYSGDVSQTLLVYWREHCHECAPPECYHTCALYEQRQDKRCVRVKYGIYQNQSFDGLFRFGADVRFKRWARLGTMLYPVMLSPQSHRLLQKLDNGASVLVRTVFALTNPLNPNEWLHIKYHNPQRLLHKTYAYLREKMLWHLCSGRRPLLPDSFFIECFSYAQYPFRMQIEYTGHSNRFRESVEIAPGFNQKEIPFQKIVSDSKILQGSIVIYPENDLDVRVVFTWLDFVRKKEQRITVLQNPAEKVKCVAWDLDNTLWKGILIEDGADRVTIGEETLRCIQALDERGILQTIVSKNDHDEAWRVLERHGLQHYFLYPAINWGPKSANLKEIARRINIGIDTFAFIDDSPFERAEVKSVFPQVRIYSEQEIGMLLTHQEFDVPVTEASRVRRLSYLTQMQRERIQEQYSGDLISFLKDCKMNMRIFRPEGTKEITRCLELVQRSNQLNLSSRRYSEEEFKALLTDDGVLCLALHCSDRFGDYGIVGFASVDEKGEIPLLSDFVISCRVAQKRVEHAFLYWLARRERVCGKSELRAELIKTKKNGPLVGVFRELPFVEAGEGNDRLIFRLPLANPLQSEQIIAIQDQTEFSAPSEQH